MSLSLTLERDSYSFDAISEHRRTLHHSNFAFESLVLAASIYINSASPCYHVFRGLL
uniref:Uncharacterized protein n=1 Tax=Rhizophora mucronata TaxID=61149 RepID=A0A2P2PFU5_RHIMU